MRCVRCALFVCDRMILQPGIAMVWGRVALASVLGLLALLTAILLAAPECGMPIIHGAARGRVSKHRDVLLHGDGDLVQNLREAAINILSNDAVCISCMVRECGCGCWLILQW